MTGDQRDQLTIELTLDPGLPIRLADLHHRLEVGDEVSFDVGSGPEIDRNLELLLDLVAGAGFIARDPRPEPGCLRATRDRTLADTIAPGMRVLVCGLNPSLYAADVGVGFARRGNRFWPAALDAGLVTRDRDPQHALRADRVGMTDLVKRATTRADALTAEEYRTGLERVARLVRWTRPGAILFVGLTGWRVAVDPKAVAGLQERAFGDTAAYVMPSTSGANAHASLATLTDHLRAVMRLVR